MNNIYENEQTSKNISLWMKIIEEGFNRQDPEAIMRLSGEDSYIWHGAGNRTLNASSGIEELKAIFRVFPDYHCRADMFGKGDRVVNHWEVTATHRDTLLGIPATGKKIRYSGIAIARFEDNRIIEEWEFYDELSLLQQIGAVDSNATNLDYSH